ncbi:2-hydroxyacyl-CoA dehydratase [Desulfallas sp. Bu1-1]|uniref:2-hydroxyacyl-CoA dehydratase subunit D n=1 Tax=Desulfallas sp. Bu1-1 TaxID=2787620 RepID=UPI00189D47CA|nr:2-hydroxyacyl-CoA dehydratase family protein [Desulfallas sp. Bu1-1]MBF7082583.1 2-hydroxyacyl-CoA dehydratase [Desulfallas sp. Bu1-1]
MVEAQETNAKEGYFASDNFTVGWTCSYIPEEIIAAAGLKPYRLVADGTKVTRADACLPGNFCAQVTGCLDAGLAGRYPYLSGVVIGFSCNAAVHLYNAWRRCITHGFVYGLELPRRDTPEARKFFSKNLGHLLLALEQHYGRRVSQEDLWRAIAETAETRRLLRHLYHLRREARPLVSGSEAMALVRMAATIPKNELNPDLVRIIDNLTAKKETAGGSRPRILVTGGILPPALVELIEECGGLVVCEDACNGLRYFTGMENTGDTWESGDPLLKLATAYLGKPPCPRMSRAAETRSAELIKLAREYRADGVVYYSLKFCDVNLYEFPLLKKTWVKPVSRF